MGYSHVIWDWNGTLLNDAVQCVGVANGMLRSRGLKEIDGVGGYRAIFGFPVSEFYKKLGFDFAKEPFEELAAEYTAGYNACAEWVLQEGAVETLERLSGMGIRQVVLSAAMRSQLVNQMEKLNATRFFDHILGVSDVLGAGKTELAAAFARQIDMRRALFVGDTVHDCEVARATGASAVLFSNGHQSRERLAACGVPVIDRLEEVVTLAGARPFG